MNIVGLADVEALHRKSILLTDIATHLDLSFRNGDGWASVPPWANLIFPGHLREGSLPN
jgi:hypothetical protein